MACKNLKFFEEKNKKKKTKCEFSIWLARIEKINSEYKNLSIEVGQMKRVRNEKPRSEFKVGTRQHYEIKIKKKHQSKSPESKNRRQRHSNFF